MHRFNFRVFSLRMILCHETQSLGEILYRARKQSMINRNIIARGVYEYLYAQSMDILDCSWDFSVIQNSPEIVKDFAC